MGLGDLHIKFNATNCEKEIQKLWKEFNTFKYSSTSTTDELVKVSSNDTFANYLISKILESNTISVTENNNGANENITLGLKVGDIDNTQTEVLVWDGSQVKLREVSSIVPVDTSDWNLTGNSGTLSSTNFLGTTDNNPLAFRVNNQYAGFIGTATDGIVTSGGYVSIGQYAGNNLIPLINNGTYNNGRLNTLIGQGAGYYIGATHDGVGTPSGENVFVGNWAGYFVQNIGRNGFGRNVFIGQSAGFRGVGSGENTGVGCFALEVVNKGVVNVGLGRDALRSTVDGDENVGLGGLALVYSSTGVRSVTITNGGSGYTTATVTFSAPYAGGPGLCNATATGTAIISGGAIIGIDITNPGCGYSQYGGTLYPGFSHPAVTITIIGDGTGATATATLQSASYNTSAGGAAGLGNRIGRYNSYFGYHSGTGQTRYWDLYNTLIGAYTDVDSSVTATTAIEKATAIGYGAKIAQSNSIILGATGVDQPDVGIGTITPTDTLHIVGTFRYQDGTEQNGYILTSDANGVASWQAAPAGYTDEEAQDAVGNILTDGNGFNFNYDDLTPAITLSTNLTQNSIPFIGSSGALTEDNTRLYYSGNHVYVNSIKIGRGPIDDPQALVIGNNAGANLAAGSMNNTFIGYNAGNAIITGGHSVALGWRAMESQTTGSAAVNVVAIGQQAVNVVNANGVVAVGAAAAGLYGGTSSSVYIGTTAGYQAITDKTHAHDGNVGIGVNSLYKVSCTGGGLNGRNNTAIGYLSGFGVTTGQGNIHLGVNSGGAGTGTGSFNIAIGLNSRYTLSGANYNIAVGHSALFSAQTGSDFNVALGHSAGSSITTGAYNVIIGGHTGASIATLSNNILIADGQGNLRLSFDSAGVGYLQTVNNDNTEDKLLTWNSTTKEIEYRDVSTVTVTETDPIYSASSWFSTTNNSGNWDTAFGWGNHASAGYALDANVVHLTGNESIGGTKTFTSDIIIPDEAYGIGWDGSLEAPTKNAIYDKIESLSTGWGLSGNSITGTEFIGTTSNHAFEIRTNNIKRADFDVAAAYGFNLYKADGSHLLGFRTNSGYAEIYPGAGASGLLSIVASSRLWLSAATHININPKVYITSSFGSNPTAKLHIEAGSATASTAPIKLTAGTNLTTPEAGAVEFNGTNLFYTTSTPARKTIANLDDVQTFASDISVPDDAYDATSWNGNFEVPTKNAIRDKIESMSAGSGITRTVVITSGNVTMGSSAATDYMYFVSGAHTVSLPAAAGNTNRYTVKNNHSANITIDTAGAENVEGAASISIAPAESVDLISDGTDWYII